MAVAGLRLRPRMSRPWVPPAPAWLAVAAGGLLGSELRYGLGLAFPDLPGGVPWATLAINVSGSFLLAALTTFWLGRPHIPFWLRAGLGPGLLGSFTTFSAVVYSVNQLAQSGAHPVWVAYLALSLVLGLAAATAGWRLGQVASRTRSTRP